MQLFDTQAIDEIGMCAYSRAHHAVHPAERGQSMLTAYVAIGGQTMVEREAANR